MRPGNTYLHKMTYDRRLEKELLKPMSSGSVIQVLDRLIRSSGRVMDLHKFDQSTDKGSQIEPFEHIVRLTDLLLF